MASSEQINAENHLKFQACIDAYEALSEGAQQDFRAFIHVCDDVTVFPKLLDEIEKLQQMIIDSV